MPPAVSIARLRPGAGAPDGEIRQIWNGVVAGPDSPLCFGYAAIQSAARRDVPLAGAPDVPHQHDAK